MMSGKQFDIFDNFYIRYDKYNTHTSKFIQELNYNIILSLYFQVFCFKYIFMSE